MKEFLNKINWKSFTYEMLGILAFFSLSYWAGNNIYPHNVWFVPAGTILVGLAILFNVYMNDKIKQEKNK